MQNESSDEIKELNDLILQPALTTYMNIKKAKKFLETANINLSNEQYDSAVNRCYYSMMRSLRALLYEFGVLEKWRPSTLSPNETHNSLEKKLRNEIINKNKLLELKYFSDFIYVKEQRMLADYNELYIDSFISEKCIKIATEFLNKVKELINN